MEQLKRESSVRAVPGEEAAASPALQALREKTQAVLAELEAAKPATAAAGTTASLPDGLKDFTPLAKEPEIKAIAEGLHELDLAVARSHTSEAALAALRAEAEKLAKLKAIPPLERCATVLAEIVKRRDSSWFREPVPADTEGYAEAVTQPMDYGTIGAKLSAGGYGDAHAFAADMRLVCANAVAYSPEVDNECNVASRAILKAFEKAFVANALATDGGAAAAAAEAAAVVRGGRKRKSGEMEM